MRQNTLRPSQKLLVPTFKRLLDTDNRFNRDQNGDTSDNYVPIMESIYYGSWQSNGVDYESVIHFKSIDLTSLITSNSISSHKVADTLYSKHQALSVITKKQMDLMTGSFSIFMMDNTKIRNGLKSILNMITSQISILIRRKKLHFSYIEYSLVHSIIQISLSVCYFRTMTKKSAV